MSTDVTPAGRSAWPDRTLGDADARPAARVVLEWIAVARRSASPSALFFLLPFVFVVLTALMSDQQALTRDLWPRHLGVGQLRRRLEHPGLPDLVAQHPALRRAAAPS